MTRVHWRLPLPTLMVLAVVLTPAAALADLDAEVAAPGAAVRQAPDPSAPVIATLEPGTKVRVAFTQRGPGGEWARVSLPSGGGGFVQDQQLRRLTAPPSWRETGSSAGVAGGRTEQGVWVKLKREGNLLLVPALVNGQVQTLFVLDTGASSVTISEALAASLSLEPVGPARAVMTANGVTRARPVLIDSIHLPDESGAGAARVEGLVATLPGFPGRVGGLLGQTFLRRFRVSIDAEKSILHLDPLR